MGNELDVYSEWENKDIIAKAPKVEEALYSYGRFRDVSTGEVLDFDSPTSHGDNLAPSNIKKLTDREGRIEGYETTVKTGEITTTLTNIIIAGIKGSGKTSFLERHSINKLSYTEVTSLKQENASLKTTIEKLRNQAHELQELLSEKYSAKKLLTLCISASIALGFNLVAWYDFGVYLIHPALTIIGLIGTVGFGILSFWRSK